MKFYDEASNRLGESGADNATFAATNTAGSFEDGFTGNSSGGSSPTGQRYYRLKYSVP